MNFVQLYCIVVLGFLLIELKLKDCIVLFSKKKICHENFLPQILLNSIVLYCIVFRKIKFLGFLIIELKLKDCIVLFSKKFCHENFLPQIFLSRILSNSIVLYCIPKNQISRFHTYRVEAKRLRIVLYSKLN